MNENDMLRAVLGNLSDIIIVEDNKGNILYQNHPEVDSKIFSKNEKTKLDDEFFDENTKRWYKLAITTINVDGAKFILKKYGHITKIKKQQSVLEIDGKTGLLRHEIFRDSVEYLSQIGKEMVLVLIDIDYFKKINDSYGHNSGDDVLSKIGLLIKSIFRSSDLLGRFGGDEFILALVNISLEAALQKLEILREAVTNIILTNKNTHDNVSISAGCIAYDNNLSYSDNFNMVDEILYISKENGRNQVNSSNSVKIKKQK